VSLAWRISEEPFARRHLGTFNDLKLRASYGRNGNQEGINLYDYLQLITIGRGYPYPFGAGGQDQSAFLSGMVSKDRTWETIATTNVGLDATLLSSRLNVTFDYFVKRNNDMLVPVTYPAMLGATPPFSNAGELKAWGFETSVAMERSDPGAAVCGADIAQRCPEQGRELWRPGHLCPGFTHHTPGLSAEHVFRLRVRWGDPHAGRAGRV